jgi:hypothetical protein
MMQVSQLLLINLMLAQVPNFFNLKKKTMYPTQRPANLRGLIQPPPTCGGAGLKSEVFFYSIWTSPRNWHQGELNPRL